MYDLNELSVAYGNTAVLKDICLRIGSGEKVVIIGPSGAGKTTLLRKLYELRPQQCAFIHQDYALVPQLSAFHNVYVGQLDQHRTTYNLLTLIRPQGREIEQIQPIFAALKMEEKMFERVSTLSGGQQQRVAVARAVFRGCEIILGDEPVSSVDPLQAGTVLQLINNSAATVVLAMHDVKLALAYFPRVIGLRDGRLFFDLSADDVDQKILKDLYQNEASDVMA